MSPDPRTSNRQIEGASVVVLWLAVFLNTGRSQVTGASILFHLRRDRIFSESAS
jgi:hypothetical protein